MINLIPPEGQKIVKREYIYRVGGTLGLLFGFVFVLLTVALVPTYLLVGAQIQNLRAEVRKENDKREAYAEADAAVAVTKQVLAQLKKPDGSVEVSGAISEMERLAPESISFSTFVVMETKGKVDRIQAQGRSASRGALVNLKSILESSPMFSSAEVPISDLARDVDLPFTITVTLESS